MGLSMRIVALAAAWIYFRQKRRRRKIRSYVRGINLRRTAEGEFEKLVAPMRILYPDDHFEYFRMSSARFDDLLGRVAPYLLRQPTHRMPISPMERLAITVRYLASGGSLSGIMYSYRIGQATIAKIIRETTSAIWNALKDDFLQPPTRQRWQQIALEFWNKWNFPLCLGAIDGKHVPIKKPPNSGSLYYNYKQFFSIVLLAVADANYKFLFVDIGGYGSEGDAGLFGRWSLSERLQTPTESYANGGLDAPYDTYLPGTGILAPHVVLGDEAFPLQRHLLKPYKHETSTGHQEIFNYRLSRARRVVENAFGVLTTRWRVLENKINVSVNTADDIVKACVVLHNYLKSTDATDHAEPRYIPENYVDYENENGELVLGQWRNESDHEYALFPASTMDQATRGSYAVREKFKTYLLSDGQVPWQNDAVKRGQY